MARLAELFNHRIGITNTTLDWTKDGLREFQQCDKDSTADEMEGNDAGQS